jgi:hypothetical protein
LHGVFVRIKWVNSWKAFIKALGSKSNKSFLLLFLMVVVVVVVMMQNEGT